eukprot:4441796-Lingulodinium_polyedra.AAC.1
MALALLVLLRSTRCQAATPCVQPAGGRRQDQGAPGSLGQRRRGAIGSDLCLQDSPVAVDLLRVGTAVHLAA